MRSHAIQIMIVAAAMFVLMPVAASASPGSLVIGVVTRGDGTVAGPVKVNIPGVVKLQLYDDVRVVDQELTIQAGGSTGWHSHPGPVLVTVKAGTFRYQESDCSFHDYTAGQTVIDSGGGHVHIGRNVGTVDVNLSLTFIVPPGAPLRIDVPAVDC